MRSTATRRRATRWPRAAATHAQVIALTQAGEDLALPEEVDLAFCRFLLLHVLEPGTVVAHDGRRGPPRRLGGGSGADHLGRPDRRSGAVHARRASPRRRRALLPALVRDAGLEVVDAWAEAPAGVGPGPVARYLESLTGVDPGDDPVVLPPLVTVIGRRA